MKDRTYIAIDLKSFYASVECRERGLDPLDTNLVVADESRTDKTICLAVTPSLKSYGISGRGRLFEVKQRVKEANAGRQHDAPGHRLDGTSHFYSELQANPYLAIDFIIAPPRMAYYMEYSTRIYQVYLKYIAPEDIVVYSIDEVFMDVTDYLNTYKLSAHDLAMKIILDVLETTGITATAGIGTNLFLCKVAMDIVAKHIPADKNGVRIAELDEMKFRRELWSHQPLTDFWRVGRGIAKKLEQNGMFTMGDVALCSERNEDLLYKLFGKNAELLIDHAWGWEPTTIEAIKAYRPSSNSLSSGQVLHCPYEADKAKLVIREMTDLLVLDLVDKGLVTDHKSKSDVFKSEMQRIRDDILFSVKDDGGNNLMDTFISILRSETARQLNRAPADFNVDLNMYDPWNLFRTMQIMVNEAETGMTFRASDLGMGVQASITIAILKAYSQLKLKNQTPIFIDEPELYLHPQGRRNFYKIIRELADNGTQVFITTHSTEFVSLDRFNEINIVRKSMDKGTYIRKAAAADFVADLKKRNGIESSEDDLMFRYKDAYENTGDSQRASEAMLMSDTNRQQCSP